VRTGTKLAAYGLVLVGMLGGGAALGAAAGPIDVGEDEDHALHGSATVIGADRTEEDTMTTEAKGLAIAEAGYRFVPETDVLPAGGSSTFPFSIRDPNGEPVTRFDQNHERELHLILVSRDLVDYAHLHPTRDASGTWSVTLPPVDPGSYRVYADFQATGGPALTLGADLTAGGQVDPAELPAESRIATVDDYEVSVEGSPNAAGANELAFTVRRAGAPVRTEPYLGAGGHLVAIRDGDLAYLHVHPLEERSDDPAVRFMAEFPSAGTYRLFLDFAHAGEVRTAAFTVHVGDDSTPASSAPGDAHGGH
jgi:hypothetical protein